jgi:hypothetical protein
MDMAKARDRVNVRPMAMDKSRVQARSMVRARFKAVDVSRACVRVSLR